MKNRQIYIFILLGIFLSIISCSQKRETIAYQKINLATNWTVHQTDSLVYSGEIISTSQPLTTNWYKAEVPSTVMGVLTSNNVFPDLFVGKNIQNVDKKLFDTSYWYRNEFAVPQLEDHQHVILNFDGISYYANIWLNGKLIASRDSVYGPYRHFSFEITSYIEDNNVLAVEVFKAQPGDPNVGFADWNPRPADENMGIFREVTLDIISSVKLNNTYVSSKVNLESLKEAWLSVETEVVNMSDKEISGSLIGTIENITFSYPIELAAKEKRKIKLTSAEISDLHIKNPRLWWCHTMGSPELYQLDLQFKTKDNVISDKEEVTFGIREVESYITKDGYREFKLNGKKVLLKAAGWTDDIFLRDTPESNEIQVQYVKDMNMNMIRFENFWGNNSSVYDLCDRYGLLSIIGWTCQWEWEAYYGKPCSDVYGCIQTDAEIDLIAESFSHQVLWLRNHPNIIAWMPGSDMLPAPKLEEKYLAFLKEADNRIYIGAAKERLSELSGKTGTKMAGPYEYVGPNYWYTDTLYGGAFGFNTETGIGAQLPVLESLEKFIPADKLWPINDNWNFHCTSSTTAMNSLSELTKVIDSKYGKAKNLDDYLIKADLVNYDATRAMFEAFRVNISKTTGLVQWMLNSAWPSLYWQLYDYYKVPTAAYYSVKKANAPLQLMYNYGNNSIYVVNETIHPVSGYKAVVKMFNLSSELTLNKEIPFDIEDGTSLSLINLEPLSENVFLYLEILDKEGKSVSSNFYCLSEKQDEYDWSKTTWVYTPTKKYSEFFKLANIDTVKLDVNVEKKTTADDLIYTVVMKNTSQKISFFNILKLKDDRGNLIVPAFWSDNYISVLPEQEKVVVCRIPKKVISGKYISFEMKGWNHPYIKINNL